MEVKLTSKFLIVFKIKSVVQAVCICGSIYNPLLMLLVCWSGVY